MPRRAAVYCRISQDRTGAGLGVERQRDDCLALARRLGWTVVVEHQDNDLSAYSGKPRPGYKALLADLQAGRVDAVLAWHTDRLHRSPLELESYIDVCEHHDVVTHTVKAGELDLTTAAGRMVARMLGAAARHESEQKSERTRRAQLQAAESGRWLGGPRPFGWQMREGGGAVLDRTEARELRKAAKLLLAGASIGSVVADLNARGITTSTGKRWSHTTLRQVLRRPRNAGLSVIGGEIVGASTWAPVLSEDTWRAVRALLEDPGRRTSTSNRARWLMAGLALCGTCNGPLRSATVASNRARGSNRTVYRCSAPGTGHVARAAPALDEFVSDLVVARLSSPDARSTVSVPPAGHADGADLRVEAVALRMRLGEAADSFADGVITAGQLAKITGRVRERLDDVEVQMTRTARGTALAGFTTGDPRKVWDRLPIARRRAVVAELMTVTVLPTGRRGNVFDPESVHVEWRAL